MECSVASQHGAARTIQLRYRVHALDMAMQQYAMGMRAVEVTPTDDPPSVKPLGPVRRRVVRHHIRPRVVQQADGTMLCEWPEVHAAPSRDDARGLGLFATVPIRAFTRLDYFGVRLPARDARIRDLGHYCVGLEGDSFCIDAHPDWNTLWTPELAPASLPHELRRSQLRQLPSNLMFGSLVNEPSPAMKETPNMKLFATGDAVYFLALRDIDAGDELLTLYGGTYARGYESPVLWLDYELCRAFWRFSEGSLFVYRGSWDSSFSPSRVRMRWRRCVLHWFGRGGDR